MILRMAVKVVIYISAVALIALFITQDEWKPFFDEAYKGALAIQGKCPDIQMNTTRFEANNMTETGIIHGIRKALGLTTDLESTHCYDIIQYEVVNKGKNRAENVKVTCDLTIDGGYKITGQPQTILALQSNDRVIYNMDIEPPCQSTPISHTCSVAFVNPCQ